MDIWFSSGRDDPSRPQRKIHMRSLFPLAGECTLLPYTNIWSKGGVDQGNRTFSLYRIHRHQHQWTREKLHIFHTFEGKAGQLMFASRANALN